MTMDQRDILIYAHKWQFEKNTINFDHSFGCTSLLLASLLVFACFHLEF